MARKLRVSPTEYYRMRKSEDDSGITFHLSPYSCMRPVYFRLDKVKNEIEVKVRESLLYKGRIDLPQIKDVLKDERSINPLEIATILTLLEKDTDARRYSLGSRSPFDRVIFALAYEGWNRIKKLLDEILKKTDSNEFVNGVLDELHALPPALRDPMIEKLRPYISRVEEASKMKTSRKEKVRKRKKRKEYPAWNKMDKALW